MNRALNYGSGIVQYVKGAYGELRTVTWPNRQQITQYTVIVLVTIAISVLIISGFDYLFQQLTQRYLIR
jgi:preprotein translocase SecE subunit